MKVECHAQQRSAVTIAISRVKIEIVLAIGHDAALVVDGQRLVVMTHDRPLPLGAPGRRAGRHGAKADRPAAGARRRDTTTTDKTFLHVIETAGVEVIDIDGERTSADERIHQSIVTEEGSGVAADLVRGIAPDEATVHRRAVRLAYA